MSISAERSAGQLGNDSTSNGGAEVDEVDNGVDGSINSLPSNNVSDKGKAASNLDDTDGKVEQQFTEVMNHVNGDAQEEDAKEEDAKEDAQEDDAKEDAQAKGEDVNTDADGIWSMEWILLYCALIVATLDSTKSNNATNDSIANASGASVGDDNAARLSISWVLANWKEVLFVLPLSYIKAILQVCFHPYSLVFMVVLSFASREIWRQLPPWAHWTISNHTFFKHVLTTSRYIKGNTKSGGASGKDFDKRKLRLGLGEAGLQNGRDISQEHTIVQLLKDTREAFQEFWGTLTKDGIKPGLYEVFAYLRLLYQIKEERAMMRDERYSKGYGVQVEDPKKMIKEKGIDEALDFADWAYVVSDEQLLQSNLQERGFNLLRRDFNPELGRASFFIAAESRRKVVYIAIKGSDTSADFLANFCMRSTPYNLKGPFVEGGTNMLWSHEGHSLVAQQLVTKIEMLVRNFILPQGYSITFVGHSLGGSLACACAIILRSRLATQSCANRDMQSMGQPYYPEILADNGEIVKVIAFAPAPFVNEEAAMMCKPFITSVVNNSDVIPRWSMQNLFMGMSFLKIVRKKLDELKARPSLRKLIRWRTYIKLLRSPDPFMSVDEFLAAVAEAFLVIEKQSDSVDEVFVPGEVIIMYDLWSKPGYESSSVLKSKPGVRTAERMLLSDGKEMVMRYLEFDPRMFADHTTAVYHSSVNALLTTTTTDETDDAEGLRSQGEKDGAWSGYDQKSFSIKDIVKPSIVPLGDIDLGHISRQSMEGLGLNRFIEDGHDSAPLTNARNIGGMSMGSMSRRSLRELGLGKYDEGDWTDSDVE